MKSTASFSVSTYGSETRWSFEANVRVGDAEWNIFDSVKTYPSEELALQEGEETLAKWLREAIVTSVGLKTGALRA